MSAEHRLDEVVSFDSEMQSFWHRYAEIRQREETTGKNVHDVRKQDEEDACARGSKELEHALDKAHATEEENRRLRREVEELSFQLQRRKVNKRLSSRAAAQPKKQNQQRREKEKEEEDFFNYDSLPLYSDYVVWRHRQGGLE
jgi:hypothetical protein